MRRTALLVVDTYYPNTMAGSFRPGKMAKFLPEFGWNPIVLCREWTPRNCGEFYDPGLEPELAAREVVRIPSAGLSRNVPVRLAARLQRSLWPYHAPVEVGLAMLRRANRLIASRSVDVIWSSYVPGVCHWVASRLTARHAIPWIADFRDLPDQSDDTRKTRRMVAAERRLCARAAAITTTSPRLAERLSSRHGVPVHTIENGFDEDDYRTPYSAAGVDIASSDVEADVFTIAYFGILYRFRDPQPLIAALELLVRSGRVDPNKLRVDFYGTGDHPLLRLGRASALRACLRVHPRLSRADMFARMAQASVLLNLQSDDAGGAVPSKLLEYLGARRPILNVPGDGGPVDELIRSTGSGETARSSEEVAGTVARWYEQWSQTGRVTVARDEAVVRRLGRRDQAKRLAELFDRVLSTRAGS